MRRLPTDLSENLFITMLKGSCKLLYSKSPQTDGRKDGRTQGRKVIFCSLSNAIHCIKTDSNQWIWSAANRREGFRVFAQIKNNVIESDRSDQLGCVHCDVWYLPDVICVILVASVCKQTHSNIALYGDWFVRWAVFAYNSIAHFYCLVKQHTGQPSDARYTDIAKIPPYF